MPGSADTSEATSSVGRSGKSTAVPPLRSGRKSSKRKMSKEAEANTGMRSTPPSTKASRAPERVWASCPWDTTTAFGRPVLPDV